MDKQEKKEFIEELLNGFTNHMLEKIDKIPENWTGKELREYVFQKSIMAFTFSSYKSAKLVDEVSNEISINNL